MKVLVYQVLIRMIKSYQLKYFYIQVFSKMDCAKYDDVYWIPFDGFKFPPPLVLRLEFLRSNE